MKRALAVTLLLAPSLSSAEPGGRCEADMCEADAGPRPWILTDGCRETTDVVGYRHCTEFAQWDATARDPELALEIGFGLRHIVAPRPVVTDAMTIPRVASSSTPMADIATTELRVTRAWQWLYVGGELSIGDLTRHTYPYGAFVQGGGLFGLVDSMGPFDVGAEALVAGRSIRLTTNINRLAPAATEAVIEARVRGAWWMTPWMTITAEAGAGVLDRSEWLAVVGVGVNTRSFGGRR